MAELWYYTSEGKQMDPVTIGELRRFVSDGALKPTDLVWKEGMPRWIRAGSVKELYPEPIASLEQPFTHTSDGAVLRESDSAATASSHIGTTNTAPKVESSAPKKIVPRDEDSRPRGNKRRSGSEQAWNDDRSPRGRRERMGGGSNFGIYIAILFGGLVLLSGLIVGVLMVLLIADPDPAIGPPPPIAVQNDEPLKPINPNNLVKGVFTYNAVIGANEQNTRWLSFQKGVSYGITVKTQPRLPGARSPDVDIHVLDSNGDEVAFDISEGPDSNLGWSPRDDGEYQVELRNLHKSIRVTSTVTIREEIPPPGVKDEPPLPPGTKTGKGILRLDPLPPGQDHSFLLRVKEGHRATIRVTTLFAKADANIHVHVLKDADGTAIVADTKPGAHPKVDFTLKATEIIRVRIRNASNTATSKCTVSYDGGM